MLHFFRIVARNMLMRNKKQLDAITIYSKLKNTFTENYRMFKKSSMEHLTLHRNQAIKLQCKLVDLFLIYMSLHRKGLLDSPEYKKKHLYKTQVRFKSIQFTLTRLLPWKNV